ncbi:hypothetical protein L915_12605 [Phytophthora nicotianae]|nr:hypothetical protein L915_12605 [Phytophthora nicotianae]
MPKSIHFGLDLTLGQEVIKLDPNIKVGMRFESRSRTVLPFTLDVAVKAFWKFFGYSHGNMRSLGDTEYLLQTNLLSRSFAIHTNFQDYFSQLVGKYTCRKIATEDEVTLVWVECTDVEEFGGSKFKGMQYLKRGYVKLRKIPREGPGIEITSTILETYSETTPAFREDIDDQAVRVQIRDLVNSIKRSYSRVNRVFCQTISNLLIEEDWKTTIDSDKSKHVDENH